MYRQILIYPDDWDFQRIIFRKKSPDYLKVCKRNTVIYGAASAPCLATRCICKFAEDYQVKTIISSAILDIDDLIPGFSNELHAFNTCKGISCILKSTGFELRKCFDNSKKILYELQLNNDPFGVLNSREHEQSKLWKSMG